MAKNYQRKQTALIFAACLILVGGTAIYVYGFPSTKDSIKFQNIIANAPVSNTDIVASSSTEWQKQFFVNNKTGNFKATTTKTGAALKEAPLNPTELLGRNFFTKYVELRQSGLNTDSQAVNNAATQLISESVAGVAKPKAYTAKDIVIIPVGNNIDATKKYATALVDILKSWMPEKNETDIAMEAYEKGDMTLLKGIDPIIVGYKTALARLIATPVVQPLAEDHLNLVNGISVQIFNAQSLRNSDTDPVTGLAAVSLEVKSLQAISSAVADMGSYFAKEGILFTLPVSGSKLRNN